MPKILKSVQKSAKVAGLTLEPDDKAISLLANKMHTDNEEDIAMEGMTPRDGEALLV